MMKGALHKLLVVDDIAENRDLLVRYFGAPGFETAEAHCGLAALNMIKQQRFNAVFLDIMMPEVDGIEVLKKIRAHHSPADLPVIMVSALTARHDIRLALDLGANDYITKPIDLPGALTKLQRALGPRVPERERLASGNKATATAGNVRSRREMRKEARRQLQSVAWMLLDKQTPPIKCTLADLSVSGACVVLQRTEDLPSEFILLLTENGAIWRKCRLVWRAGLRVGIEFKGGLAKERPQIGALVDWLL